jgi:hypothetical protein
MATIRKKSELNKFLEEYNGTELNRLKNTLNTNKEWILGVNVWDFRVSQNVFLFRQTSFLFNHGDYENIQTKDFNISGLCLFAKSLNYALFLELNDTQEIALYKLYKDDLRFEKINEYCDINELRRCINEYDVTKDDFENLVKETPTGLKVDNQGKLYLTHDDEIISGQTNPVKFKTIFGNQSLYGDGNIDLYRHQLSFNVENGHYNVCAIIYSSNPLKIDSLQDLTTVTKASAGYGILAIGNNETGSTNPNCIVFNGTVWKAGQGNCNPSTGVWSLDSSSSVDITSVNDIVTTL